MREYLDLVERVLTNGVLKKNRTGVDTLSCFAEHYSVDLSKGYPLLTTKKVNFKSMLHEVLWYLSGEDHIRNLREHTKIWDAWADENGNLDSAYGRYWRRFPSAQINAETGRLATVFTPAGATCTTGIGTSRPASSGTSIWSSTCSLWSMLVLRSSSFGSRTAWFIALV